MTAQHLRGKPKPEFLLTRILSCAEADKDSANPCECPTGTLALMRRSNE